MQIAGQASASPDGETLEKWFRASIALRQKPCSKDSITNTDKDYEKAVTASRRFYYCTYYGTSSRTWNFA